MKKARKGFTLVELLIVIAIMALLGSMGLVSGREANSIAEAQKIVENFHLISAALEMYYGDHGISTTDTPTTIKTALGGYLKNTDAIDDTAATPEKFQLTITAATDSTPTEWWLTYTLKDGESSVAKILANKAAQEGFMASTSEVKGGTGADKDDPNTYASGDGKVSVCYKAH